MQTLDQISMKFETWAIFMSLYGMVCQKDIGSISPYPRGISANPFNITSKKFVYKHLRDEFLTQASNVFSNHFPNNYNILQEF